MQSDDSAGTMIEKSQAFNSLYFPKTKKAKD